MKQEVKRNSKKLEIDFKNRVKIEKEIYVQSIVSKFLTVIDNSVVTNYYN